MPLGFLLDERLNVSEHSQSNNQDKVFKSGLSKFLKGCHPQNLLSKLLNALLQM